MVKAIIKKLFGKPDFYMVLGFRNFPVNPNDYGLVNEADNPLIIHTLNSAIELAKKVTKIDREEHDFGKDYKAQIAEIKIL